MLGRSWDSEIFEILNLKKCQNSLSGNASDLWQHSYRICKKYSKIVKNPQRSTVWGVGTGHFGSLALWVSGLRQKGLMPQLVAFMEQLKT